MTEPDTAAAQMRQYFFITANYWAFTLTDGALRMLVILYFHGLGYSPLDIALMFVLYELCGVVTNLTGGWLGARWGLNRTMQLGLGLQVVALAMLLLPTAALTVPWVMLAQALSGTAKDLNKMSAKSAVKFLVPSNAQGRLYKLVALLTGSKNALKGLGFFVGAALLSSIGFRGAIMSMGLLLAVVWAMSLLLLQADLGKANAKPKFQDVFSKSAAVNTLSAARLLLFGARDVWFVIALPVYLASVYQWDHLQVGSFLALWIMGYGAVQALAPKITGSARGALPDGRSALLWVLALALLTLVMAFLPASMERSLLLGLLLYGVVFAVNSSLHSYLIVSYASADRVSLDVGFYYMANAMGRLIGTVLSGWIAMHHGMSACLLVSAVFLFLTAAISTQLPRRRPAGAA